MSVCLRGNHALGRCENKKITFEFVDDSLILRSVWLILPLASLFQAVHANCPSLSPFLKISRELFVSVKGGKYFIDLDDAIWALTLD